MKMTPYSVQARDLIFVKVMDFCLLREIWVEIVP